MPNNLLLHSLGTIATYYFSFPIVYRPFLHGFPMMSCIRCCFSHAGIAESLTDPFVLPALLMSLEATLIIGFVITLLTVKAVMVHPSLMFLELILMICFVITLQTAEASVRVM